MKRTPFLILAVVALALSVALYSCSKQENAPTSSTDLSGGSLAARVPAKPVVTPNYLDGQITANPDTVLACVSNRTGTGGKLVLEKATSQFTGADTACYDGAVFVEVDSTLLGSEVCDTLWVPDPGSAGTYGFKVSYAPTPGANKSVNSGAGSACTDMTRP
jgi:hypothetical protein